MIEDLEWALEDLKARAPRYHLYRAYDEGDHRLLFATEKYRNAFGDLFREFADNLCEDVVDGITDRLQVMGWTSTDQALNSLADEVWTLNQGQSRTGAVHRHAFREGDGFSMVQLGKDQRARIYKQKPSQMAVRYDTDNPDEMAVAAKVWKVGKRWRCNLYYPDGTTERWASKGSTSDGGAPAKGAFSLMADGDPLLGDGEAVTSNELGIPVFHFPNGDLSGYGKSILRGVIPLQDALNKAVADMLVTMEGHAAPLRWATGIETEYDPVTGQEKDPFKGKNTPGSVLRTGNKDADFGQFDASEMNGFLDVQDQFKIEIARKGYLPPYAITFRGTSGNAPSGISLLVAEGRTVKLAKDRQRDWGQEHRRQMAFALNLERGTSDVTPDDVDLDWAPPETRDEQALVELLLLKKELGVPKETLLKEAGYSQDEVDEFLDQAEAMADGEAAVLSVLQGGRAGVPPGAAQTLTGQLGVPAGPVPPGGAQQPALGQ